jgi:hypothetical protein
MQSSAREPSSGAEVQADDHDLDALRRRARQRGPVGGHPDLRADLRPNPVAAGEKLLEVRSATAAVLGLPGAQRRHGVECLAGQRPDRARVQVRVLREDGKACALLGPVHVSSTSTGA